jgi:hypothetical protein
VPMNYLICLAIFVFLVVPMLIIGDRHPRVDGSDWRVRPSRSGKTWVLYRRRGFYEDRAPKYFKSPADAEAFARERYLGHGVASLEHGQFDHAPGVSPPADRLQMAQDRARRLAQENWIKAHEALAVAKDSDPAVRLVSCRLATLALEQVRRHGRFIQLPAHMDIEGLERRVRGLALDIFGIGGPASAIPYIIESPVASIPAEVKVAVWSRDGGGCVECGCAEGLRFASAAGKAARNDLETSEVQLACEACLRRMPAAGMAKSAGRVRR